MGSSGDVSFPRVEGVASRQAHADLPAGSFERELGKEGFFGPATHLYHAHAPTGWTGFDGPLRPRAFDLSEAREEAASPWQAAACSTTRSLKCASGARGTMDHLARNADGDELLFVHEGDGELFCDWGHLRFATATTSSCRAAMWRIETARPRPRC